MKHFFLSVALLGVSTLTAPAFAGCNSGNAGNTDLLSSANCQATATGASSLAVGSNGASATGDFGTAIGSFSGASGLVATAIGRTLKQPATSR